MVFVVVVSIPLHYQDRYTLVKYEMHQIICSQFAVLDHIFFLFQFFPFKLV